MNVKIKTINLLSPWMTKDLWKSSKKKKKYEKFSKKRNSENRIAYKSYKNIVENLKWL